MALAVPVGAKPRASISSLTAHLATTTIAVEGMTCGACTSAIESAFENQEGIGSFTVSLITERAVATHDPNVISAEQIAEIIEDRGFDARVLSTDLPPSAIQGQLDKVNFITTISVEGMTCGACTAAIDGAFKDMPGIIKLEVSLLTERAVAVHDPKLVSAEKIAEEIEDRGFGATILDSHPVEAEQRDFRKETVVLNLHGLSTQDEAVSLETILEEMQGIENATVTLKDRKCRITYSSALIGIRTIVETIESQGLNAVISDNEDNNAQLESLSKTREIHEWRYAFYFSLSFAVPVFILSMIVPMWIKPLDNAINKREILFKGLFLGDIICLALTIPVQFGIGKRFYKSAFKSLKHGSSTMDVLVVMGTSAAFFFSVFSMIMSVLCPPHNRPSTVFDTSTMLIMFISLGRFLENRAKGHTSSALSRLMSLAPSMATIYADPKAAIIDSEKGGAVDGIEEKLIPTELIQVDDIVILRPGDKVPADGIVTFGSSFVNEAMVTGEPMPIEKKRGDNLIGGTVNGSGRLDFKVTRAGRDTQLSQIVMMVQSAQTRRAPIQQYADKIAGYFVPTVLTLGILTFVVWMILAHVLTNPPALFKHEAAGGTLMVCLKLCISVIVFACPCALGLSTPTAVMVGTGVGAENGILFKGGPQLEAATTVKKVIFDKTGTLTYGKMTVSNARPSSVWASSDWRKMIWWSIIGLAENNSEHPIGKAIVAAAKENLGLGPEGTLDGVAKDFEAIVGQGLTAKIRPSGSDPKFYKVILGNEKLLLANNISFPSNLAASTTADQAAGKTQIYLAIDGTYAGSLSLSDTIKPTAARTVSALKRMGLSVAMVTGDTLPTALAIANEVGIPAADVYANASPADKRAIIERLQTPNPKEGSKGIPCAMIGDGINDSPALATAAIGIALSSGTDVAVEAADIVLMRGEHLLDIPAAFHLASSIFRRIKLNLAWACMYNVFGLPFAMGFFLPLGMHLHPMAAGAAMAASSVSVVCSSLMLKWWRRPEWMEEGGVEREGVWERLVRWVWQVAGKGGRRGSGSGARGDYVPLREVDEEV